MADVALDLYPGDEGTYAAEVVIGPGAPWVEVAARSASIHLGIRPPATDALRLTFRQAVASSLGLEPLVARDRLILAYIYRPTDRDEIFAFDRRITTAYTTFFATVGEQYTGTFDVEGLPAPSIGEFSVLDVPSRAAWAEREAGMTLTPEIAAIVDECRLLQDRSFERFAIWLTPRG